jgi:hypothetical protein
VSPEGGSPIRASLASSLAQYASKIGRRVDKAAAEADVGVSRLSLVAQGEVRGCFFPLFLQDGVRGAGGGKLSPTVDKLILSLP